MGFSQALSGLNAAASSLDVLGNNIANSQTVGYKSSGAQFADVYAGSTGLGTQISRIQQDFSDGNIESTGRNLDLAISGDGFYRFQQDGEVVYSRNGQLTMTSDGYLENAQGARIMGYGLSDANNPFSEVVPGGQPTPLNVPAADMPSSATQLVEASYNLNDAVENRSSVELSAVDGNGDLIRVNNNGAYDAAGEEMNVPLNYHYSNSYAVYDSLGNRHNVSNYFEKVDDGQWKMTTAIDGNLAFDGVGEDAQQLKNSYWLNFNGNGQLATYGELDSTDDNPENRDDDEVAGIVKAAVELNFGQAGPDGTFDTPDDIPVSLADSTVSVGDYYTAADSTVDAQVERSATANDSPVIDYPVGGGANAPLSFAINLNGTTQFANDSTARTLSQDGYTSGALIGITVEEDGTVMRNYANEQSVPAGQIVLASFRNPEGLNAVGDNAWKSTVDSGQELVGVAGTGTLGDITSGAIETSNVDLASELVDMIVTQRAYQANSKTISTQDELVQAAINLSR